MQFTPTLFIPRKRQTMFLLKLLPAQHCKVPIQYPFSATSWPLPKIVRAEHSEVALNLYEALV